MEKQPEKYDPDVPFWKGITIRQFMEVIKLATARHNDWEVYDPGQVSFAVFQMVPTVYNGRFKTQYIKAELPIRTKTGKYAEFGFEVQLHEDGFFAYTNGDDIIMRHSNPAQVAEKVLELMKTISAHVEPKEVRRKAK